MVSEVTHLHEICVLHHALIVAIASHDMEEAGQTLLLDQEALLHVKKGVVSGRAFSLLLVKLGCDYRVTAVHQRSKSAPSAPSA